MNAKPSVGEKESRLWVGGAFTVIEVLVVMAILCALMVLTVSWGVSAIEKSKVRQTQAVMGSAVAIAELIGQKTFFSADHRFANMYWVQPHVAPAGTMPTWSGNGRPMSSMEFLLFLASKTPATNVMVMSMGARLQASPVPVAWGAQSSPVLVDVFEQNPLVADVLYKAKCPSRDLGSGGYAAGSPAYVLQSDASGYPLRSLFDPWGNELVYRQKTFVDDLNQLVPTGDNPSDDRYTNRHDAEIVVQDESVAEVRGMGGILPATAAYAHGFVMSAGPDGHWGSFIQPTVLAPLRDATGDRISARDRDAKDNLYSFEENQ